MCYHNYQHYHQVATKTYGTIGFILLATDIELHFLKWGGWGGGDIGGQIGNKIKIMVCLLKINL